MNDQDAHIHDKDLSVMPRDDLVKRLRKARQTFIELKAELAKANSAIEAYAKDNGLLRSKIESLNQKEE